ncbi:UNKNOWN [Stylonychia lemnae]|uniref:Uncharacterized protein n=1 Tax=Stylonychia lemnae TaxID=5949 RepID=A0A078ADA5_STYLE|nr:UNKNOWN [Stylonychia lemnae]|eukprot:CDW80220.1 UNKNOWN [Stylonychia lemnae]
MVLQSRGDNKLAKKSFFLDLDQDQEEYNVGQGGFDLAFGMNGTMKASIGYFTLNQVEIYFNQSTNSTEKLRQSLEFTKCDNRYFNFPNQDKVKLLIRCNYLIKNNNCSSKEDIETYFNQQKFNLAFVNQYFDFSNFTDPVQKFIDDAMFFQPEMDSWKAANIYISPNQAELYDDIVTNTREYSDNLIETDGILCTYYIRMDKQYDIYSRQQLYRIQLDTFRIYGLSDLLGDIGGFKESLYLIGMFLVGFIQEKLFFSSLLKNVYQVEQYSKQPQEDSQLVIDDESSLNTQNYNIVQQRPSDQKETVYNFKNRKKMLRAFKLKKQEEKMANEKKADYYQTNLLQLNKNEKESMLDMIMNRQRFNYSLTDLFNYLLRLGCCTKNKYLMMRKSMKKHALFGKGQEKLQDELDCVTLLKSIRSLKLLVQVFMNENQKMLLRFQRRMILDSESTSTDSDRNDLDTLKLFESKSYELRGTIKRKLLVQTIQHFKIIQFKMLILLKMCIKQVEKDLHTSNWDHKDLEQLKLRQTSGEKLDDFEVLKYINEEELDVTEFGKQE